MIELEIYEIKYIPRTAKKQGQVIADFLVELQSFDSSEKELMVLPEEGIRQTLNLDRASNRERDGVGVILESSFGVVIKEAFRLE